MLIRRLFSLLLCLILGLSSGTMAVARGQASGGMAVTICSGYGVVTVYLDEQGNPQPGGGMVHMCPECLAGLGLAALPAAPRLHRPLTRSDRLRLVPVHWVLPSIAHVPQARGPPLSV
jgi:hypothetical protein